MIYKDPLEKKLEQKFFNTVRNLGGLAVKIIPTLAGPPDRFVIFAGRTWLVELKKSDGECSKIQEAWHKKALGYGVPVYVLYGEEGMRSWLKAVVDLDAPRPGRKPANPIPRTLDRLHWYGLPEEYGDDVA